jgi:HNH endonuclease
VAVPDAVCVYCGEDVLTTDERPEHPLPEALGSRLTTRYVCDPCNEWAGREVDQPFLREDWIEHARFLHKTLDRRGRREAGSSPLLRGETSKGVRVRMSDDGEPEIEGGRIIEDGEKVEIIAGTKEEADRLLKILRERLAESGKSAEISEWRSERAAVEIKGQGTLGFVRWGRMAAKMGLGLGSLVYPAEWRLSPDAERLREQMRDPHPRSADGTPMGVIPGFARGKAPFDSLVRPPEHLLMFMNLSRGTCLIAVVFGELVFGERVRTDGARAPDTAWAVDPRRGGRVRTTTMMELVLERHRPRGETV